MDDQVAEPGADVNLSVGWPVHQFQRDDRLAWELEHRQACRVAEVHAADLLIAERGVEVQRGDQVRDAICGMEGPHATTLPSEGAFANLAQPSAGAAALVSR